MGFVFISSNFDGISSLTCNKIPVRFTETRSVSISSDLPIVKSTFDVFITYVFKSVLLAVSVGYESFCFTDVVFSSPVYENRFLSCGLIIGVSITSLLFLELTY